MPDVTVRVEGLDELRRALREAENPGLPKALAQANKNAAELVAGRAAQAAPHRSGRLAASVRALGSQRLGRVKAGNAGVAYAAAIHWGRSIGNVGRPPGNHKGRNPIVGRPFLTDAAARSQGDVVAQYEAAIRALVVGAIEGAR